MRIKSLIVGTIAAGLLIFTWGAIYNSVFSASTLKAFANDSAVVQAIRQNAPANGIYLSDRGVFAAVDVRADGSSRVPGLGLFLGRELLADLAVGFVLTIVLLHLKPTNLPRPIVLALVGVAAGIAMPVSDWNWFGFASGFTLAAVIEVAVGWMLAGFVLTRFVLRDAS
jgi:hypothetical protein